LNEGLTKYFYAAALCLIGKHKTAANVTVCYTCTQVHTSSVQGIHFYQFLLYLARMQLQHENSTATDTGRQ